MPKARKTYNCTLCGEQIPAGSVYYFERLAPWNHELNESFSNYRAHTKCDEIWIKVGESYEWEMPYTNEFREAIAEYNAALEGKSK